MFLMKFLGLGFSGVLLLAAFLPTADAARETSVGAIGRHVPIFIVEKSENPQNVLVAYTKLAPGCGLSRDPQNRSVALLDFYWMMARRDYKPVHPLIKRGIRGRIEVAGTSNDGPAFSIRMNDLSELRHDISVPVLTVTAVAAKDGGCDVVSTLRLGPSDHNRVLNLTSLYTESKKTFFPPFRKVVAVTLNGLDAATGEVIRRRYVAK